MIELNLSVFECRVLGVLAEKQMLTPDQYPLTLNVLVNGCNQLSSRDPVMSLTDGGVDAALKQLQERRLTRTYYPAGSRVAKYEHMMVELFTLDTQKLALLTVLLLRGPQTSGELRGRTNRMYPFASVDSVEHSLKELAALPQPLVSELPRAPGTKEPRWMHLLSGEEAIAHEMAALTLGGSANEAATGPTRDELASRVAHLEQELTALREEFEAFKRQF
jgi:uncharacterized protein